MIDTSTIGIPDGSPMGSRDCDDDEPLFWEDWNERF